jgi:hypothetical protein
LSLIPLTKRKIIVRRESYVTIPDDATVVRGGQNLAENFANASGVKRSADGKLDGVSVNAGAGASVEKLTAPNPATGYPGIPNNQIGVTTAGKIRDAGGDVKASPTKTNPFHATMSGLTPQKASELFTPTIRSPQRRKEVEETL